MQKGSWNQLKASPQATGHRPHSNKQQKQPLSWKVVAAAMRISSFSVIFFALSYQLQALKQLLVPKTPQLPSLRNEEVEALHEIFHVAKIPLENDICNMSQVECHPGVEWSKVVALVLSERNLTQLPDSVGQLSSLQLLMLNDNKLTSLPQSLGDLQSLSWLDLQGNHFTQMPDPILKLKKLEVLDIHLNQISSLPESFTQLEQLRHLYISSNRLVSLPASFGSLTHLRYLNVAHNRLTQLPSSMGSATQLLHMRLESNCLTSLPESFSQLHHLKYVNLHENQLTSLPKAIGNLSKLRGLTLNSNHLKSLPESMGQLLLNRLHLDSNRLTSLPVLNWGRMYEFRASRNRLRSLPAEAFGDISFLRVLSLHDNFLETLPRSSSSVELSRLEVVLLHGNRLRKASDICNLQLKASVLKTLYLHRNQLRGQIPECLGLFRSLQVLTLHRNFLTGPVPGFLATLNQLNLLTLHRNRLHGNLPTELSPKLAFFSAHSNSLVGPIPPFKLLKDCVDDDSFVEEHAACLDVQRFGDAFARCQRSSSIRWHCPKTCNVCSTASAAGPVLLLHDNRLSCGLPEQVTAQPEDSGEMRSISLVGNMLGNGSMELPAWIHRDEHQPFLYVSGNKAADILLRTILLAFMCALCWWLMFGFGGHRVILASRAEPEFIRKAHRFLLQMCVVLCVLAAILLVLYRADATYYSCGSSFSSTTVSNYSNPDHGNAFMEWAVACLWTIWIALGTLFLREAPKAITVQQSAGSPLEDGSAASPLMIFLYSLCWLCIVAFLSFPSVAYAVVSAIPFNNTLRLSAGWLEFFHQQAAVLVVLVDMFITPKVVVSFSRITGIRRSMLLMAARLGTMWLAVVLSTLYLTTHCMNGWAYLWRVCDETTEDYKLFNITLGGIPILEPKADLCSAKEFWWSDSACPRAVVSTVAPLLVSKMATRAFLQPMITLLRWHFSSPRDGQLYMLRGMMCTSRSLELGQQASLLVTWAEVVLLWGALVPVLLPAVLLATAMNLVICKVGHGHFGVAQLAFDKAATGMSRRYLHGSLGTLVCFQNWFAWSSGMNGRWLLLLAAVIYVCERIGCVPKSWKRKRKVAVLESPDSATAE